MDTIQWLRHRDALRFLFRHNLSIFLHFNLISKFKAFGCLHYRTSHLEFLLNLHNLLEDGSIGWFLLPESLVKLINFSLWIMEIWEPLNSCRSHGKDIGSPFPPYLELGYLPRPRHLLRTRSWCCQPRPISWNKSLQTLVTGHFAYALYPLLLPPCQPSSLPYPRIPGSALWKEFVKCGKPIMVSDFLHFDPIQFK